MTKRALTKIAIILACAAGFTYATIDRPQRWPGGDEGTRIDITAPDMGNNLSGAVWNPVMEKLWVVSNDGEFWRMGCSNACDRPRSWSVDQNGGTQAHWKVGGDSEAITQAAWNEEIVFIGVEKLKTARLIREYAVSGEPGDATLVNEWSLTQMAEGSPNQGLEALTFVPDEWLKNFVDGNGNSYPGSRLSSGGLFFAGLQSSGEIFVFDLDRSTQGKYIFVGRYATGESEIAGLEFDRSDGSLYSYHNYGRSSDGGSGSPDVMLSLSLASEGTSGAMRFPAILSWAGPRIHNNEGIALAPAASCGSDGFRRFFLVTDDGGPSNSVGIYPSFPCSFEKPTK